MTGKQVQRGGDDSVNVQAAVVHVQHGLGYEDTKAVALDVFRANFLELAGIAAETARARAEEITQQYLEALQAEHATVPPAAAEPDMQRALYGVQAEYATTGDRDMGDVLVDLLVQRTTEVARTTRKVVLSEALAVVPKLTSAQMAALSLLFVLQKTINVGLTTIEALDTYVAEHVAPFAEQLPRGSEAYEHLVYAGCAMRMFTNYTIEEPFRRRYGGLLTRGFTLEEVPEHARPLLTEAPDGVIIPCLRDADRLQVGALNEDVVERNLIGERDVDASVKDLFQLNLLRPEEVWQVLLAADSRMGRLQAIWSATVLQQLVLTPVGVAIGHANWRRITGEQTGIDVWLPAVDDLS